MNPTVLKAGYKVNVVPQTATAEVDGRFLPGYEDEFYAELDRVLGPGVTREFIHTDIALETTPDGALYDAMTSALTAEDPEAKVIPYCLSGAPTPSRSAGSACAASALRRCSWRRIWTFPECSTASTNGFRSTACASASAFWIVSWTAASADREASALLRG